MINIPEMIMIGSTGRNLGKTEFAVQLIKKYSSKFRVIGLKVTTIRERDGKCPRGGDGCGVCSSLENEFCLTEETEGPETKDTVKLLQAGAEKVYWLRVMKQHLKKGITSFMEKLSGNEIIICESNSLAAEVKPGMFVIIKDKNSNYIKESCSEVISKADKIIISDKEKWDIGVQKFVYIKGSWHILDKSTAVILSGGKSKRMGTDKSLLDYHGLPMIQYISAKLSPLFENIMISANDPEKYRFLNFSIVSDNETDIGPLMGIASCLLKSDTEINFFTACDTPDFSIHLIEEMLLIAKDCDAVVPVINNNPEPLFAVYKKKILPNILESIKNGERRIISFFNKINVKYFPIDSKSYFKNINTIEDYNALKEGNI